MNYRRKKTMKCKKLLRITECYFSLPDDFNGTLGEALTLLAEYTIQRETINQVQHEEPCDDYDYYDAFINDKENKVNLGFNLCEWSPKEERWIDIE